MGVYLHPFFFSVGYFFAGIFFSSFFSPLFFPHWLYLYRSYFFSSFFCLFCPTAFLSMASLLRATSILFFANLSSLSLFFHTGCFTSLLSFSVFFPSQFSSICFFNCIHVGFNVRFSQSSLFSSTGFCTYKYVAFFSFLSVL